MIEKGEIIEIAVENPTTCTACSLKLTERLKLKYYFFFALDGNI